MPSPLVTTGVALVFGAATLVLLRWWESPRRAPLPWYGWLGLTMIVAGELLMFRQVEPFYTWFTPWVWTGYILLADAGVFALRGKSLLKNDPREFAKLAYWSVPLWLVFEAYNMRLQNWEYHGQVEDYWLRIVGYMWAFATIIPALFETADLLAASGWFEGATFKGWRWYAKAQKPLLSIGLLCLVVPLFLPQSLAVYTFGAVWLGFIWVLEPINLRRGHPSLLKDMKEGNAQRFYCLLAGGMFCGLLWEFWNFWAGARWVYTFPILQEWRLFEMPLPGYLGFPFFALECYALYYFVSGELQRLLPASTPSR